MVVVKLHANINFIDRKKVVEVSFLPADVEEIESHSLPKHSCDVSFYVRKFRQIKVSETMDSAL